MSARKTIVRTITATTIKSANVTFVKGVPTVKENAPLTINGTINEDQATKEVRKAYGQQASVTELIEVNDVYEISVEDFMKHAKKVEAKVEDPAPNPTPEGTPSADATPQA